MPEINLYVELIRNHVSRLCALMASDEGASAVEYSLVVSLVAATIVALVSTLGARIVAVLT
jgi:Flp pilus assembly pilin Flp